MHDIWWCIIRVAGWQEHTRAKAWLLASLASEKKNIYHSRVAEAEAKVVFRCSLLLYDRFVYVASWHSGAASLPFSDTLLNFTHSQSSLFAPHPRYTLFKIFIFCPKIQLWKTRENVVVLDFLAVDNFDFTRKIVKKNLGEKLGVLSKLNFWTKIWLFE